MSTTSTNPAEATPDQKQFLLLKRKRHTLIPVFRTINADLETPVSAFLRVASAEPEAFLLESVEGGERVGRYTFIGVRPYRKLTAYGRTLTDTQGRKSRTFEGDVFQVLQQALSEHTPAKLPGLPPFTSGAVGFFSYDVVRQIERLPSTAADELHAPDACLMFFDEVLAFDHVKKQIFLIVTADLLREPDPEKAYRNALKRLDRMEKQVTAPLPAPLRKPKRKALGALELKPRTPKRDFLKAVDRVKEYVAAGDVFQCVLSQRFDCRPEVDAFEIYRALRIVNPSPYMYYLRFPLARGGANGAPEPAHIVGSSPELLVRVKDHHLDYRPIAGSRPRGDDEASDARLEEDLRRDAKETAEHVMLVDLGRNDLGRVSDFGTVQVKDLMVVERYSHIMHLVSSLRSRLRADLTAVDAFRSCFPAGTLSGAPKIRAMEIIEELEPARRGIYGGSILYADFSGNLDSCIAIRTLFMHGNEASVQAGAGIVADSVPATEFEECVNKSKAVVRAIERARAQASR
ncbi:anthranilate synthase component I [Terriglobus aquaticus]|uniref:Anthranilate synthase component 1 n=1 Tax=Terriglobus aquaticus TaxID=940139 RepID=A0ABW9KHI8_9BACT|nr:anthranilate synthase component I [Terriglobus aquaticus]